MWDVLSGALERVLEGSAACLLLDHLQRAKGGSVGRGGTCDVSGGPGGGVGAPAARRNPRALQGRCGCIPLSFKEPVETPIEFKGPVATLLKSLLNFQDWSTRRLAAVDQQQRNMHFEVMQRC